MRKETELMVDLESNMSEKKNSMRGNCNKMVTNLKCWTGGFFRQLKRVKKSFLSGFVLYALACMLPSQNIMVIEPHNISLSLNWQAQITASQG